MTMKEINKAYENRMKFHEESGLSELSPWLKWIQTQVNILYKEGYISDCSNDFLAYCNGYQANTGDYETLHILQTLDLRSVTATKATARKIAEYILNH